jgi:hypothetical protein
MEVIVRIMAASQEVFAYFTDRARYVQWMGSEAKLEPEPGSLEPVGFQAPVRTSFMPRLSFRSSVLAGP